VKLYQYYFYTTLCHADCSQQWPVIFTETYISVVDENLRI
jgi:hypothetical protein